MKPLILCIALLCSAGVAAQEPPPLTVQQRAAVKKILAPYQANRLSVDDAKAIKRALRDAGMHRSKPLDAALREAGFSADRLEALDPRPSTPPSAPDRKR